MRFRANRHRAGYPAENKGDCCERSRVLRGKGGFSLLEVLIGATVLSVGLLGLASMFPVAYLNVDSGGKLTEATALAQSFIEQLRTRGANNFDAMVGDFPAPGLDGFDGLDTINCQGHPTCDAWLQAVDVASGGPLPQGRVTVTINCTDAAGNPVPAPPPNDCTGGSQPTWLANITVTVTWTNLRGAGPTVSLMTRVMQGG